MTDKEIVFELLELGFTNRNQYADPTMSNILKDLGAARIAVWLEELTKIGLVNDVKPIFTSSGGNFAYKLNAEALKIYNDKEKLYSKLSKILPDLNIQYQVFLSYSNSDTESAKEIAERLEKREIKCFLAEVKIDIGTKWMQSIHSAIKNSKLVMVLLTPRSIDRPWVLIETGAAWALEKPLIPVLKFLDPQKMPDPLQEYQARIIETSLQLDKLVSEIEKLIREL